ncbi:hypothetical protein TVAG_052650 [Trichomonas vaginalis G3]|uniref:DUF4468 domain-containing protein n=1 Tax=Trichomonas vaginalis (strain ATCC PRA-98 / G3) TaxID=412133 RepID=A2G5Y9_TRIV3|nr:hypothetical protein TVAGG3_0654750 [Trichomonas vaginalis G3]EAX87429.1 hypothetical protein TVAG_052650 [Trichomonas vaginalis G3]KAI5506095.1 hypothetical protein TVAGG3_0654750 [Trichomonas vaginalis G3]|eukprot:XP_001300359.1 hypothetical protein [Trichomonas vaginalis G3]
MLSFFSVLSISGTTVTVPPIEYKDVNVKYESYHSYATLATLEKVLVQSKYLTPELAKKAAQKMKFATTSSTLEHTFTMDIDPKNTTIRFASRIAGKVTISKNKNSLDINIKRTVTTCKVISQIVTTRCKSFLWWEWDKSIEIQWRPLEGKDLEDLADYLGSVSNYQKYFSN